MDFLRKLQPLKLFSKIRLKILLKIPVDRLKNRSFFFQRLLGLLSEPCLVVCNMYRYTVTLANNASTRRL